MKGPGLSPVWVIVLCSWARHFTLTVPLSNQEYKWVLAKTVRETGQNAGGYLRWTSVPSQGGVAILLVPSYYRNRDKLRQ